MQSKPGHYSQYQTPEKLQGCLAVNYTEESLQWFVNKKKKSHPNFFSEPFSKHTGITFRSPPCFYPLNYTSQNSDFYENVQNPCRRRVNHTEFYQPQPFLIIWKSRLGNGYVVCCHFFLCYHISIRQDFRRRRLMVVLLFF